MFPHTYKKKPTIKETKKGARKSLVVRDDSDNEDADGDKPAKPPGIALGLVAMHQQQAMEEEEKFDSAREDGRKKSSARRHGVDMFEPGRLASGVSLDLHAQAPPPKPLAFAKSTPV